ncbi:hypothetical protein ID866_11005, partial [Astraeus odoratus]
MGGKSSSAVGKTISERVNEAVPIKAASKYVAFSMDSIKNFIAEAEKE